MSVSELKHALDKLSTDDRLAIAEHLRRRSSENDAAWEAELGRRLDRCLAGGGHGADELLALHDRLSSEGR